MRRSACFCEPGRKPERLGSRRVRPAETPAAATACLAKLRELMEITRARRPKQTMAMIASAPRSPIAARAGSQTRLSRPGDAAMNSGESITEKRDMLP